MTSSEGALSAWEEEQAAEVTRIFNDALSRIWGRPAAYRYWRHGQHMFAYTTERVQGKYLAYDYVPHGRGARSGDHRRWTAEGWKAEHDVRFTTRRAAKARAYERYQKAVAACERCQQRVSK